MSDLIGKTIGAYQVVEKLGEGGMAEVYKAYQPSLERHVALKFIRPELAGKEGFRPRFEQEAKLLARLNHPHIIHIYDFGEAEGRLYLVMEYVPGGTLKDHAARLAEPEALARLLDALSAGLDYAHGQGIIHRDIKPGNLMFTADERPVFNDFGLAKLVGTVSDKSEAGDTSGTPDYMAPEQVTGDPARVGAASDIYALGVVMFELLTGRVPFTGNNAYEVMFKHVQEEAPSPRAFRPDLPEAIEPVLAKALAKDPDERYAKASELAHAFREAFGLVAGATVIVQALDDLPPEPGEPPFKGLQYFDEADAERFFGREQLVAKLADRLRHDRFLAVVVGASGSGKSSLVRAGLVPVLRQGGEYAAIHIITPTAHPLEALAVSLTRDSESVTATTMLMDDMGREGRSLHRFMRKMMRKGAEKQGSRGDALRLLLVVDQFEELFTLCHDETERKAFIENLTIAVAPETNGPTTVAITLRADFYAHCAPYPALRDAVAQHQEYIGPMSAEELRRAIEEPARLGGWTLEAGLMDTLLKDVGDEPGALPLLSHALLETWQRRRGRTLTLKGYAESGGVRGAIAQTAEAVYQQLTPEQQAIAQNIFLRLTELGEGTQDTRRRERISNFKLPTSPNPYCKFFRMRASSPSAKTPWKWRTRP